jgi:signal transduction histidine kinase
MRKGLTRRMIVASGLLALLVGAGFAVLLRAIELQRDAGRRAVDSQDVLDAAATMERLVLDLETGQRGFLITRTERFLQPWTEARRELPGASRTLTRLSASDPVQERRAREIVRSADSYVQDYSLAVVAAARRDLPAARSAAVLAEGKRRVDEMRRQFDQFIGAQRDRFEARADRSDADARRAIVVATTGLAGSILLIAVFGGYMTRAVVSPLRRTATMATRLAAGDLAVRVPETGPDEIGALERAFNTMGSSLEVSRDELRQLADEQAALRRVATLVARAVPAPELFEAVTREVGLQCDADLARMERFESDHTVTAIAAWTPGEAQLAVGRRFALEGESIAAQVHETGRPARVDSFVGAEGPIAREAQALGIRASVGCPIVVGGQPWGVIAASTTREAPFPPDTESRIADFTELVATAIANANSRAELAASRARVVATADETRRRIERDLHDGAQQRLTHTVITLKLARRSLGDAGDPAAEMIDEALGHAERATAELRELAHGILPAVLTRSGLRAGIETLVTRVKLPVTVDVTAERFPEAVEATAYFIVAEALTNVVKHAAANTVGVSAFVENDALHVEIRDDGVGGAQMDGSSGLVGLSDRAAALNGELRVQSAPGAGTVVLARLPIRG